jgi:leucyl aminopeptidase
MRFEVKTGQAIKLKTPCLILPVYTSGALPAATRSVDSKIGGHIAELLADGDIEGKIGDALLVKPPQGHGRGLPADRLLLIGCGERKEFNRKQFRKAVRVAFGVLRKTKLKDAVCFLNAEAAHGTDAYRRARIAVEIWHHGAYRYTTTKSADKPKPIAQKSLGLAAKPAQAAQIRKGIKHGDATGQGMLMTRELGNLPANHCTPSHLVKTARGMAKGNARLSVDVLTEADMKKLGMGALLSVTAGTAEPAKLIVLKYNGAAKSRKPVALVGKGVTFDSGGISLKPGGAMDEMKFDMCGAATVIGVFEAIAILKPSLNLIGVIPACENLPGSRATKPGDVVTSMSGKTIEILNTDAEGRLILADALTYVQKFKPELIIDMATLTGACLVALGRHRSGLLSNSDKLANALIKAGDAADDPAWRLPLDQEYKAMLKTNFADLQNIGGRDAGTITAGAFLAEFVGDYDWAHLDIAGTAWLTGGRKGGTGRPVPLLLEYLLSRH